MRLSLLSAFFFFQAVPNACECARGNRSYAMNMVPVPLECTTSPQQPVNTITIRSSSTSKVSKPTSTSKSSTSTKTSSSYSSYHGRNYATSSYRYSPSSYRPMYYTNLLTFILIYDIAYLELRFIDASWNLETVEKQYCPLKYCRFINETTINTPLRRNVSVTEMIRRTNHTQNATTFQTIWKTTYGCSINFDECLTSNVDPSFFYFGWIMCLHYVVMLVFLCLYG